MIINIFTGIFIVSMLTLLCTLVAECHHLKDHGRSCSCSNRDNEFSNLLSVSIIVAIVSLVLLLGGKWYTTRLLNWKPEVEKSMAEKYSECLKTNSNPYASDEPDRIKAKTESAKIICEPLNPKEEKSV